MISKSYVRGQRRRLLTCLQLSGYHNLSRGLRQHFGRSVTPWQITSCYPAQFDALASQHRPRCPAQYTIYLSSVSVASRNREIEADNSARTCWEILIAPWSHIFWVEAPMLGTCHPCVKAGARAGTNEITPLQRKGFDERLPKV